jgi:type VI secretion system protein ImpC
MSAEPQSQLAPETKVTEQQAASLLEQMISAGRYGEEVKARERGADQVKVFVRAVLDGAVKVSDDVETSINTHIAQLDRLLSIQIDEILHDKDFQRLEASWRGLRYLLDQSETGERLHIKVLNVTQKELLKDFRKAPEFDRSTLFQKVYDEGYGIFGGAPFGALIGDYEFSRHPEDVELLERVAQVAASAHAPFLSGASPAMLNLDDFTKLNTLRDVSLVFSGPDSAKWRSFRESEDSRYIGLCMPHILGRLPYGKETRQVEAFDYEEGVDGTDHRKYLWTNAAYALAARLSSAFAEYGWCSAIRGPEGGGKVEGLPVHNFRTWEGDIVMKCPTEVNIPERRDRELSQLGFVDLVHCKDTDYAAFFDVRSCQKAQGWSTDEANANARLSTQLPYMFAVCRFAHYIKAMMRDQVGTTMSRLDVQRFLNNWIANYVLDDDNATPEQKAKRPLRQASIEVQDVPGKPGVYHSVLLLQPHVQLDEINVSLRLVAEIPKK